MILELPYMATELGLLSLTQLQILAQQSLQQQPPNPSLTGGAGGGGSSSWMWNHGTASRRPVEEDDDSWEVRAFAEDTGNIMGTTWPPRSYTCTFCRREFRSAQALGGHMNVHRRDRARLRQSSPVSLDPSSSQELIVTPNHGLCLLYPLPSNSSTVFTSAEAAAASMSIFTSAAAAAASMSGCIDHQSAPSTLLSISPYPSSTISPISSFPEIVHPSIHSATSFCHSPTGNKLEQSVHNQTLDAVNNIQYVEELDLELRLGTRPSPSPSP